jgi:hypothetical protein
MNLDNEKRLDFFLTKLKLYYDNQWMEHER